LVDSWDMFWCLMAPCSYQRSAKTYFRR